MLENRRKFKKIMGKNIETFNVLNNCLRNSSYIRRKALCIVDKQNLFPKIKLITTYLKTLKTDEDIM